MCGCIGLLYILKEYKGSNSYYWKGRKLSCETVYNFHFYFLSYIIFLLNHALNYHSVLPEFPGITYSFTENFQTCFPFKAPSPCLIPLDLLLELYFC